GGTVWARFNLSESLPEPTPMTGAVVRGFLSGRGGFGLMYRDLGFVPDRSVDDEGVYDLVCGRPFCNLSREPLLYAGGQPYEHPFALLKAEPQRALYPRAVLNRRRAGLWFWASLPFRWPLLLAGGLRRAFRMQKLSRTFALHFRQNVVPALLEEVARAAADDLTRLDDAALQARLAHWVRRTLTDFAREGLKPTVLAELAGTNLENFLRPRLGPERAREAPGEARVGGRAGAGAGLPRAVRDH